MKRISFTPAILGMAVAGGALLAGCNNSEPASTEAPETTTEMPSGAAMNNKMPMDNAASNSAALNSEELAGPFTVTLKTAKAPEVGDAQFTATVTRDGKPVEDATVKLDLSMPTMKMGGPDAELKHTSGGAYEGRVNLGMGGHFQAKVTVAAGGESGTATYGFDAMQAAQ